MTRLIIFALLLLQLGMGAPVALAGRPLTIDDAEPMEKGMMEFEAGSAIDIASWRKKDLELAYPFNFAVGVGAGLELGLGSSYLRRHPEGEKPPHGLTDWVFGAKFKFLEQGKIHPALAVAAGLKIPSASRTRGLSNGKWEYDLHLIASKELEKFSLHAMVSWFYMAGFHEEGTRMSLRNIVRGGLAAEVPLTEKLALVGEAYGFNQEERGQPNIWMANLGLRYAPWDFVVFDLAVGKGLGRSDEPRLIATAGFTLTWGLAAKHSQKRGKNP